MDCKLAALVIALCVSAAIAENFMLQAPRTFKTNASNSILLRLFGLESAPGTVTITLLKRDNDTVIAERKLDVAPGEFESQMLFFVPPVYNEYSARLRINGSFETESNYTIFGEDSCNLQSFRSSLVFIQTDKPFYKPGQEVKLRVLRVNENFQPIQTPAHAEIYVEDAKGARIAQWKDVELKNIQQLQFSISDEPNQGVWRISCVMGEEVDSTTVEVKEYVLPKFEVVITPPSFVLADADTIPIKICAKYTYGKLVEGTLKLNSSLETYPWSTDKTPVLEYNGKIEGCYNYDVNVSLIDQESYYSYRRIYIVAVVTEDGTGVTRNETKYIDRTLSPLNLHFQEEQRQYFKPGLPYSGKLKVTNPDSSPAAGEEVEICSTVSRERILFEWFATRKLKTCKNFTSDENGVIDFILPPQNTDVISLSLEAKSTKYANKPTRPGRPTLSQPQTSTSLRPWFSPSGSHMQVQAQPGAIPCDTKKKIEVLFTSKTDADYVFYYEVMSKGSVITTGGIDVSFTTDQDASSQFEDSERLLDGVPIQLVPQPSSERNSSETEDCPSAREARYVPPIGLATISIDVSSELSPSFYVLVYYIRDDKETVADSQKFSVEKCFNNKVELEFGDESKQPGTKTTVTLKAAPNSLCGIKVVDKSVSLLDSSDQLTEEKIFNAREGLYTGPYYPRNYCNEKFRQPGLKQKSIASDIILPPRPYSSSDYEDTLTAYALVGVLLMSDLTTMTRPCKDSGYRPHAFASYGSGVRGGAYGGPVALASTSRRPAAPALDMADNKMGSEESTKSAVEVRNFFPETWLFKMEAIGEDGQLVTKEVLPHTITEWVGNAVCLNSEEGLGLSNKTGIKGFQAFFASFTLVYSVKRGEKFPIIVTLFNYIDKALPVTVTMGNNGGYVITDGSIGGDVCVLPGKSLTLTMKVEAKVLGTLNLTASAATSESSDACEDHEVSDAVARDAVTNTLLVEPEGFPQEKVDSIIFCPKDSENEIFKREIDLKIPDDIVPDSTRAYVEITGNIMGPAVANLDSLVVMPTGCGEQNMVRFAPIVSVWNYLSATGKLTDKFTSKATDYLRQGYQRELKYQHADGSYSAFGISDKEGSIYLTAFVVASFSEASKYISVDSKNLERSMDWITSKQKDDGCFPEVGRTVDHNLKGGLDGDQKSLAPLTAYVLISLKKAGYKNETVIDNALSCLQNNDEKLSPYEASLFAYAAAKSENKELSQKYLDRLYEKANNTGDIVYFHNINGSDSLDVETAAYAVLSILESGGSVSKALPVVRWMSQKRNSRGGFVSTQDTVVGLDATAEFAALISKDPVDLKTTATGGLQQEVVITEENKDLVRRYKVSEVPSQVKVESTGTGCGLIQTILRYNTYSAPQKVSFTINAVSDCRPDCDCSTVTLTICTSYIPENQKSNMAVVEVKMLSGMAAVKETLDKLTSDNSSGVMRYDILNNNVALYFYELSNDSKCFSFDVEELVSIENRKPATCKVYDYYAPENSAATEYTIGDCGSSPKNQ